jgi:hypothetical protein
MAQLTSFLDSGRPVYAEGTDLGYDNNASELWPYFGTAYLNGGSGYLRSLTGEPGTFAEGLSFGYLYDQPPGYWVDEFGADGGTAVLRCQESIGRVVSYQASGYRTIVSSTIFGATGDTNRGVLMAAYMNYLMLGTGVSQKGEQRLTAAIPSVARVGRAVRLRTSGPTRELSLLDITGRVVTAWRLPAGDAVTTWVVGSEVAPGAYFLQVRADGCCDTHRFTVVR